MVKKKYVNFITDIGFFLVLFQCCLFIMKQIDLNRKRRNGDGQRNIIIIML